MPIRKVLPLHASTAFTHQYCPYTAVLPLHDSAALTWQYCPYTTVLPLHGSTALTRQYCPYTSFPQNSQCCELGWRITIATRDRLNGPGGGKIFPHSSRPALQPPQELYKHISYIELHSNCTCGNYWLKLTYAPPPQVNNGFYCANFHEMQHFMDIYSAEFYPDQTKSVGSTGKISHT